MILKQTLPKSECCIIDARDYKSNKSSSINLSEYNNDVSRAMSTIGYYTEVGYNVMCMHFLSVF